MLLDAIRGDFASWNGLPAGATFSEIRNVLGEIVALRGPADRVRTTVRCRVYELDRAVPPCRAEVWCIWSTDDVLFVQLDELPPLDAARAAVPLGAPERVLENRQLHIGGIVSEHVWASRGVTFSVVRPLDPSQPPYVLQMQLYAATTLDAWFSRIGPTTSLRPHTTGDR